MKKGIALLTGLFSAYLVQAQCLQIESILVDACVTAGSCAGASDSCGCEGINEMVLFKVGSTALNVSSLTAAWPNNPFRGWCQNATTANKIARLNATITKCGYLKEPVGGVLPANSEILIITSEFVCTSANSFANLQDTLIVIFQCSGNSAGHFKNSTGVGQPVSSTPYGPSAPRTTTLTYSPLSCSESVTYDAMNLVNQSGTYGGTASQNDGATVLFDALGTPTYINNGCRAPYIPIQVDAGFPTATLCSNATLTVNGTVTGPYVSYSWSGGSGTFGNASSLNTTYTPGTGDNGTIKLYFTATGKCSLDVVKDSILVTVNPSPTPTVTSTGNATSICSGSSIVLSVNNQSGTTYSWSPGGGSATSVTVAPTNTATPSVYTVSATNSCGGTNATFTVSVNPLPVVSANSVSICQAGTATLTASGANTYSWNTGGSTPTITVSPNANTSYTVTGTNNNGCTNSATANVTVNSLPAVTVNSATICTAATATLTAGGAATYTWSTGSTASTITVAPGSSTSYTVAGTDNNGCLNTAVSNITVSSSLAVSALATNTAICTGSSTSITASGASTYSWSPAGSLNSSTGVSVTANPTVTTTYTITGISGSCSNTSTVTVTVNSLPAVSGNASNLSVCQGGTVTLNGSGAQTYTWSGGVNDGVPFVPSSTQTYTVTGTDANGCSNAATVSVNVNSSPVVTAASATICPSATATLTAGGAATYTWSTGATASSVTVAPVSNASYTVTGTDNNGCVNSAVASVTISNNLVVSAAPQSASVCTGLSTAITASGASSYTWSPAGSLSSASGATVTATPSVTTTYTVDGSSGTCSSSTVVTIVVNNPPNVSANANNTEVCTGGSVTLSGSGALTYTWSGGVTNGVPFTPSATQNYTVTGTDGNGCINSVVITVTVNPLPVVTASSASICPGNSATLTAGGAATYTWSTGAQGTSATVSPTVNSTYTVVGTDANGCMNIATAIVSINPLPVIGISPSSPTVCAGSSATLTASGGLTYTWSTSQSGNPISVSPATATSYSVIGTDANGCQNSATIALTVTAPPSPQSISGNPVICSGHATILSVSAGNYSYSWAGPAGSMGTNASVTASQAGVYTVIVTNACGSVSTTFTVSVDAPVASFTANPMQAIVPASISFTNLSAGTLLSYNWNFANGNTSAVQNPTQVYNNPGSYNVSLVITDSLGCKDSATATILVKDVPVSIVIPNVFSPNADNINDVFFITASGLSELNCKIYDRWGLLLYEWNGTDGGWDGKNMSNGKQVSDGTYYYILVYKDDRNQASTKTGYLQLVR